MWSLWALSTGIKESAFGNVGQYHLVHMKVIFHFILVRISEVIFIGFMDVRRCVCSSQVVAVLGAFSALITYYRGYFVEITRL